MRGTSPAQGFTAPVNRITNFLSTVSGKFWDLLYKPGE